MSSFHKIDNSKSNISGTKLKNNLPHISSGIPSLDHVVGGGLPSGSLFVVEEDALGTYSKVLLKYFLAEGVVCEHDLLVASSEENAQNMINELPQPCTTTDKENSISNDVDKMKIAWRYEGLSQVESSFGSNTNFGHNFDLSKNIKEDIINKCNITYWSPDSKGVTSKDFKNKMYFSLLQNIREAVSNEKYQISSKENKNILRISIQSLGSPAWLAMDCEEDTVSTTYGQDLIKFIYCLRVILRETYAVAFMTIPAHLFDDDHLMRRILYSVDNAVRMESFAGSNKETNPVYQEYHGLFHVTKLSSIQSLVPFVPPSLDMAFKLKRKKFVIEKLHLPPELQETSEREQDDITATPPVACGGFKKKDIEF